jgi:predicted small integral membrane protein
MSRGGARADERPVGRGERGFAAWGTLPIACAVVTALNALYILLVTIGNVTDYGTNFAFVQHVLAMDTTNFAAPAGTHLDSRVMWRAMTAPWAQTAIYIAIIAWEWRTTIVLIAATAMWFRARRHGHYRSARRVSTVGLLMIVILFFGGFIVIGGEWFQMWRSEAWNGIDAAFRNTMVALAGLVLLHLPSPDWASPEPGDDACR